MSFVTVIVAAEEDEVASVGDSVQPLNEWSGVEFPGIDIPKIATLHLKLIPMQPLAGEGNDGVLTILPSAGTSFSNSSSFSGALNR